MAKHLYDVPGFKEKWETELAELKLARELAWIDTPRDIGRFRIEPLTLQGFIDLQAGDNAFVCGGIRTFGDVAAFLWRCNKHYAVLPKLSWRGRREKKKLEKRARRFWFKDGMTEELEGIADYLISIKKESNVVTTSSNRSMGEQVASIAAYRVHSLASAYGWSIRQIMDTPLAQLNQLSCVSALVNDPNAKGIAPLGELRQWGLEQLNKINEEERASKQDAEKEGVKQDG